ncbi:MAG: J domain-containing protein, partial [Chloroflexaceae bacterium]|nr:J domain-containing protein [Chloroflexaceae bacterium]
MEYKNYYEILGVTPQANDTDIKQAYRKLVRTHHPDMNPGNKAAEARFKDINEAYEVLSDTQKRAHYDRMRRVPHYQRQAHGTSDFDASSFGWAGNNFADFFEAIFGSMNPEAANNGYTRADTFGSGSASAQTQSQDIEHTVE